MKKLRFLAVASLTVAISAATLLSGCTEEDKKIPTDERFAYNANEWNIVFEDNFSGDSLDTTKWKIGTMEEDGNVRRAAYYTDDPENIFVSNGALTIRTNWRQSELGEGWHTSWVETSTKASGNAPETDDYKGFSTKGGYFEVRCQAPMSKGIWSAFWLMPDEGKAFSSEDEQYSGRDGVEIDIMESPTYAFDRSGVAHVIHGDGYDDKLKSSNSGYYHVPNMYTEMHTYAMEWTEDKYIFYIDGYKTWETDYEWTDPETGKKHTMGVSDVLEYMILSVEVGGHQADDGTLVPGKEKNGTDSWAGNPNDNSKDKNYDFIIDYVKVMQRK